MPKDHRLRGRSLFFRLGLVAGVLALLAVGWVAHLAGQNVRPRLAAEDVAVFKADKTTVVSIDLSKPRGRMLQGTLTVELVGPGDKSVGKATREIRQRAPRANYRFELPAIELSP